MKILVATTSKIKAEPMLRAVREVLREEETPYLLNKKGGLNISILQEGLPEPNEFGATTLSNANMKAQFYSQLDELSDFDVIITTDAGFFIDELYGYPGVNAKREFERCGSSLETFSEVLEGELGGKATAGVTAVCSAVIYTRNSHKLSSTAKLRGTLITSLGGMPANGCFYENMIFTSYGFLGQQNDLQKDVNLMYVSVKEVMRSYILDIENYDKYSGIGTTLKRNSDIVL